MPLKYDIAVLVAKANPLKCEDYKFYYYEEKQHCYSSAVAIGMDPT